MCHDTLFLAHFVLNFELSPRTLFSNEILHVLLKIAHDKIFINFDLTV